MSELDDFRGNRLDWKYIGGFPLDVAILNGENTVGRLWRKTNNRPTANGELQGLKLWIDWSEAGLQRSFTIGFTGSDTELAVSKSTLVASYVCRSTELESIGFSANRPKKLARSMSRTT